MNEIPKVLEPNERVVYEGKPEYAPYIAGALFGIIIAMIVIGIFVWVFMQSIVFGIAADVVILVVGLILSNIVYARTQYALTDKRAIIQSGIIGRDFKSISYDKMQNVSVTVGLIGTIFKVGTIKIFTGEMESVGGGNNTAPTIQAKYDEFHYITSPYEILKKLQEEISRVKK